MTLRAFLLPGLALLSACATGQGEGYPSLATRAVEREAPSSDSGDPVAGAIPLAGDALYRQIAELEAKAQSGAARFAALHDELSGRIRTARAALVLSETWVMAQVGLGRLEQARYASVAALADFDRLYATHLVAVSDGKVTGGLDDIVRARANAEDIVARQNSAMDELRGALARP